MKIAIVATWTVEIDPMSKRKVPSGISTLLNRADKDDIIWTYVNMETIIPEGTPKEMEYPMAWEPWIAAVADARARKCGYDIKAIAIKEFEESQAKPKRTRKKKTNPELHLESDEAI